MFTKATLFKTALVPLAAATIFSHHSAAATPATPTQLEVRGDAPPPPTPSGGNWSNNSVECECAWDKDHIPKIVKPCKDTVWHVGERRKVVWGKKWDDGWKHDEPKKPNGTAGDGKDWDHDGKGNDKEDWDSDGEDGKKRFCKARLFLRKGEALPFVILAEDFDVKTGFVEVTVPNVYHGEDYSVTLFAREDKPELERCSEKFKIDRDDKHRHKDCKDECKDNKNDKKCCKDDKDDKDGGY